MLAAILAFLAVTISTLSPASVQTLSGERVVLPRDLVQPVVLVAGFTKASRGETEPWAHRLRGDPRSAKTQIYEVSILDGVPGFLRGMIVNQMKSGIAPARQKLFLIVTDGVDAWKRTLGADGSDDHAYLVLAQRTGAVVWRSRGALTESSYQDLMRAIENLNPN